MMPLGLINLAVVAVLNQLSLDGWIVPVAIAWVASAVAWAYGFMLIHILGLPLAIALFLVFFPDFGGNENWLPNATATLDNGTRGNRR